MSSDALDLEQWATIEPYLDQALDLEDEARARWLAELASTRSDIASAIRELLKERAALNSSGFLHEPVLVANEDLGPAVFESLFQPSDTAGGTPLAGGPLDAAVQALGERERKKLEQSQAQHFAIDQIIGPYRLIREIGRGGMSSVWLARRGDEQLKRDIALKLPLMGHRVHVERFERERDILSTLTHPNIARLYDAGITASGQPYLAMEYVAGTSITETCDQQRATLRERLQLFLQVLEVVQFAHAQLIIHRDLKPSNILVTADGRVVVVDFGIGKLLGDTPQQARLTEMFGSPMTLDYAAPEQIAHQPLSTASDIYSLGIVLHELLVGTHPYRTKRDSRAAFEEAVLAGELRMPSQCDFNEQTASARKSSTRALARALNGDLDTIVLKSLKREPAARYASASAFAQDIDNHLQRLPISARPDSFWYRSARFLSRHRAPAAAAALIVIAMAGGTSVALWQAAKAAADRDRAAALAERSDATADFLSTLITDAAASDKPVSVSAMLTRSEKIVLSDPGGSNESRATVLSMIASYYLSMGDARHADDLFGSARSLLAASEDIDLRARITCSHARTISHLGRHAEARAELDRQLADPTLSPMTAANCLRARSAIAFKDNDPAGALRAAELALQRMRELGTSRAFEEASVLGEVATALQLNSRHAEARQYFQQAQEKFRAIGRESDLAALTMKSGWAGLESASGNPRGALRLYEEIEQSFSQRDAKERMPSVLVQNRGRMLQILGRYAEARSVYELSLELAEAEGNKEIRTHILLKLALVAEDLDDRDGAAKYLRMANESMDASMPPGSPLSLSRMLVEAKLALMNGKLELARSLYEQALTAGKRDVAIMASLGKAEVELLTGDATAAARDARSAVDLGTALQADVPFSHRTGLAWLMLGRAEKKLGDATKARDAFAQAEKHLSNTVDADHPSLIETRQLLDRAAR
ncbi:MAG: protein kinase [Steroidobacter sp.]